MRVLCIYCTTADGGYGGVFATRGQLFCFALKEADETDQRAGLQNSVV